MERHTCPINFKSLFEIPSWPELFLFSKLSIAFIVSSSVICVNLSLFIVGFLRYDVKFMFLFVGVFISDASLFPILAKYTLKEFAISIGSDKTRPL